MNSDDRGQGRLCTGAYVCAFVSLVTRLKKAEMAIIY